MDPLRRLRSLAVSRSLFRPRGLKEAVELLGFVQADPIRSPARAQDLILRHRVKGYRAGDLEKLYPSLGLEEDILYAYGFMPASLWRLVHPRRGWKPGKLEKRVLEAVRAAGEAHPSELEKLFGGRKVTNAWGGSSKATTQALEWLQYLGQLRVSRRESGIKVYAPAPAHESPLSPEERLKGLLLAMASVLAPIPEKSLRSAAARFARGRGVKKPGAAVEALLGEGRLERAEVDGVKYLLPPGPAPEPADPENVRILAPFDPVVWDRARFEHFWGWAYRFEAYTPPPKRLRGYYAMPLLRGEEVIGWCNAAVKDGRLEAECGFTGKRPGGAAFKRSLEAELSALGAFLGLKS